MHALLILLLPGLLSLWRALASPLVDFQVAQPLTLPQDAKQCTVAILQRTFASSYGSPEVVQYTPPTDCGPAGSWAGISLNFTVTSNGTQYDRLGIFTFDNVEIWRTSTPEPTRGDGIVWTALKDVTRFTPLFAKAGTFVLELDNIVETGLDGEYATTLHATFYQSSAKHPPGQHADLIIPVTTLAADSGDVASVPSAFSLNVTFPRNAAAIYAEIIPSGNGQEEFWSMNVPNEYFGALPSGATYGDGPFRETRLFVDGLLAGVVFPYLVVFTGGIAPTLWRPIAAYAALDLPAYNIDLTPFVPMLSDGKPHNITLDIVSAEGDHAINQNWYVTASLHVVLDPSNKATTGAMTVYSAPLYASTSTTGKINGPGDVDFTVRASRNIHIEAEVVTGSGKSTYVVWTQSLSYENTQTYRQSASVQTLYQIAQGNMSSTHNGAEAIVDDFSFPFTMDFTYTDANWTTWITSVDHSYTRDLLSAPFMTRTNIQERQQANAFFELAPTGNFGNGTSSNTFSYSDAKGNTYTRTAASVNSTIVSDHEGGTLAAASPRPASSPADSDTQTGFARPRLPGRSAR
ncbi:peptide N-acetyl-beta-D-glucosaminyl asparaginase amidase A-domain-containing protein [Phanerochaete sordida]|uniref:Peptide N-acetyl-beta-D-glucosaminyl asparaginase amidase A-domain-containing protein n=1 Tax=Phanerochaete sordida TaxID=48140 RepID=A0A9P3G7S9_9APHY|nr:peptide N-acetyl-beta-D-glucosaminyl asparaginase amidase A-domain-containing protein [Phanerochaete sordida]